LRQKRGIACYRNGHRYSRVQRAQNDSLPASAGKTRYTQTSPVHIRVAVQIVEPSTHGEIEQTNPVGAHEVEVSAEFMLVFRNVQLAAIQPLQAQGQDASFGKIDAPLLLVFGRLA